MTSAAVADPPLPETEPKPATKGPLSDIQHPVIDLHAHPTLKTFMMYRHFWSTHNPPGFMFPPCMRTDLDALIAGGVKAQLVAVYAVERGWVPDVWPLKFVKMIHPRVRHILDTEPDEITRQYLDHLHEVVAETKRRKGDVLDIAMSYDDMQRIMGEGKLALVHSIEGAHHLNGKLEFVDELHERGVAHMIIAHMYENEAGHCSNAIPPTPLHWIGCFTQKFDPTIGITDWGRDLVTKMWDIGMVVDLTHATPQFRRDVYEMARESSIKRPVIFSHVGMHEFCPADINPTPEDIRAVADTGGVIGIIAMTHWLKKPEVRDGKDIVLASVDHIIQHGGEDCVAFGSDFDGFTGPPRDWKSPRDYNNVRAWLLEKYTPEQVDKFLHGNADRVLREGWGKR